ncbi:MAG: HAMP domain-containing protein [Acidobacteria bacterium]|nr:HAMP domain-containing protein [Acidobacteriota bacterium]
MARITLRWKILFYSGTLLIALIGATLAFVSYQAGQFVDNRISQDLEQGRLRIDAAQKERLENLKLTAQLVASFPDIKALLGTNDSPTVRDFLTSYQDANRTTSLLIALDPQGKVIARTDVPEAIPVPDAQATWIKTALENRSATGILVAPSGVYSAALAPAEVGGAVFGFVLAGSRIDQAFVEQLRDVSKNEVAIVSDQILGSTLPAPKLPWHTSADWKSALERHAGRQVVDINGEHYIAQSIPLGAGGEAQLVAVSFQPLAVIFQSRDKALEPYRRIQIGLIVLGLVVTLAGILGSALFARTVTAPIAKLVEGTKEVAAGNFDFQLDVRSRDEIGDLATSFNGMTQGLRERADMQKFVSQSTVNAIRARTASGGGAGERRVLTIFFSDMRGFTSMSEQMAPEDVVQVLNSCLSLQTEQVKKFNGDVDKFVGDCVVALFAGEDSALRAIRCAVRIHQAIEWFNQTSALEKPIGLGIGIVTGEVVLGSIGSHDRQDFTVIGSNVNLCARLCSLAESGETLIPEDTFSVVRALVTADRLEPQHVKGFSQPVPVYRITGL